MPLQTTQPFSGGDFEAGPLTHASITSFQIDLKAQAIFLTVSRGRLVATVFTPAQTKFPGKTSFEYVISGPDYDALMSKVVSGAGALVFEEVIRELYQWLLDAGHFVGNIV